MNWFKLLAVLSVPLAIDTRSLKFQKEKLLRIS